MDREAVMTALLDYVTAEVSFVTTGGADDFLHWSECPNQPALYGVDAEEVFPDTSLNMPRAITMAAELWIYTKGTERLDGSRRKALNTLLDAIEARLAPSPIDGMQTLGGAVENCWIEGRLDKSPGHIMGQAVAVVPVVMLVPR